MMSRTASTVSRRCGAGRPYSTPCQVSLSRLTPAPRPRRNRPPDISSMSSAVTARMNGLRVNAQAIPVPTPIRSVAAASHVAWVTELRKSSGAQTQSMPAASASRAWAARSSGMSAIAAIEMRSSALTQASRRSVVQRPPQVETGEGAVRAPRLGDPLEVGRPRQVVQAVRDLHRAANTEVARGDNVGATEVEDQEHLGGPGPNALDLGQRGDDVLVGE